MITREELDKQIKENGGKEWRSYKEFREYLDRNYENKEFKIIGWVSPNTRSKWFKEGIRKIPIKNDFLDNTDLWILTRGSNYWFVLLTSKEPWKYIPYNG